MENTENQEVVNYRDQLVGRMKERYPDRNFDSIDGQNSPNSLEQAILETITEDESRISQLNGLQEKTNLLTELFNKSPRSARFLNSLARTGNPGVAIREAFGKDAYDAYSNGDASEMIASIEAEDERLRAENEQYEAEKAANLQASFDKLDKWGDSKGLNEDLFEMGWKADHYSEDIESARREGEVAGRNANIKERMSRRQAAESMPPALSGQGVRNEEQKPAAPDNDPWMLG